MNIVQLIMGKVRRPDRTRAHKWVKIDNPSGGQTIEKCIKCGIKCIIDPEIPGIRWDYKVFPRIRVDVDVDCDQSMVRKIMSE
jgi:hypothetical protein